MANSNVHLIVLTRIRRFMNLPLRFRLLGCFRIIYRSKVGVDIVFGCGYDGGDPCEMNSFVPVGRAYLVSRI